MNNTPVRLVAAPLITLVLLLAACGGVGGRSNNAPTPAPPIVPTGSIPPTSTTLGAETGNNTSASNSFSQVLNGNARPANVSKLDTRSLLYSGSSTLILAGYQPWFGNPNHLDVGYSSTDPNEVRRQVEDMISRGIQGAVVDWFGPSVTALDTSTKLVRDQAQAHPGFVFAIMEDSGALLANAAANGCDVTDQLISDLNYAASQYESSPAYLKLNGRPVIFFFGVTQFFIDWSRVQASLPSNPILMFRGGEGLTQSFATGGFQWLDINNNNPFDPEISAQEAFYSAATHTPAKVAFGSTYKGFNDELAMWSTNRVVLQNCGATWLQTFGDIGKFYSAGNQLPAIQIVTWNDYEEGTAIEPGIDNCAFLTPSQSGNSINWTVSGGDESTIDHYTIFISTDGNNLSKLADAPPGTRSIDLSQLNLAANTYAVYVKAVGKPSISNKMSPAISFRPGDTPPGIALNISQQGPFAFTASVAGSSGSVARSTIDFGDGAVVSGPTAAHTYGAIGKYLVTAYVFDAAGASSVAVQQITVKSPAGGVTIYGPGNGSTVEWPTLLSASSTGNVATMRVLIDGQQAFATSGDTVVTPLKVFTGSHQITVQSLDASGNAIASSAINVVAEPGDIPPIAAITLRPMPQISATTILGCTASSRDPDGFLILYTLKYSNGAQFFTPAALETFASPGTYSAAATVMDQFGATNSTSTTFSVGGGTAPAVVAPGVASQPVKQPAVIEPMRRP